MENELDELDKLLSSGLTKKKLLKRLGIVFIELSLLVISVCIFIIVVNGHSKYLFNDNVLKITYIVLIIFIILLILGLIFCIKNYRVKYKISNKAITVYAILFGLISINSFLFLYLLYGPTKEFKKSLVEFSDKIEKYDYVKKWFYNENEIEEIRENKETN